MNDLQTIKAHHDGLPGPAPQAAARAWDRLAAEVEAERAGGGRRKPDRRSPGAGRGRIALRAGVAVGLAAAVTVGVMAVRGGDGASPFGTRPADAAELLRHAAVVAATEDPLPRPDQFVYVDRKDVTWQFGYSRRGGRHAYTQDVRREVWIPAADPGKALTRSTYGEKHGSGGPGEMDVRPSGAVEYQRPGQCQVDVARAPSPDLSDVPTDSDGLLAKVREEAEAVVRAEKPAPGEAPPSGGQIDRRIERTVVMKLVLLVENPFASSRIRAAVFGALSGMPAATVVPDLADTAGRHGVGASIRYEGPDGWERAEFIFERETYRFLGWRTWIERGTEETMLGGTAVMATKVVDSMPEVPENAGKPAFC